MSDSSDHKSSTHVSCEFHPSRTNCTHLIVNHTLISMRKYNEETFFQNLEMFPLNFMDGDIISRFKSSSTHRCVLQNYNRFWWTTVFIYCHTSLVGPISLILSVSRWEVSFLHPIHSSDWLI